MTATCRFSGAKNKQIGADNLPIDFALVDELEIPKGITYFDKQKLLSGESRKVNVTNNQEVLFTVTVPKGVFNPVTGWAANVIINEIIRRKFDVADKEVADLGCGSGVIGFACILSGAQKVLFTDINPNIKPLKENKLFRTDIDKLEVQDLLCKERDNSLDVIIMSTPTNVVDSTVKIAEDDFQSSIQRHESFFPRLVSESARTLRAGGRLMLYVKMPSDGNESLNSALANNSFDIDTFKEHVRLSEKNLNIGRQPNQECDYDWLVFSVRKKDC